MNRRKGLVSVLALTLMLHGAAHGQTGELNSLLPQSVLFHVGSWHDRGDYNNVNLGGALWWKGGLTAGGFYNSFSRPSWYGGLRVRAYETRILQLDLMAGAITGYSETGPLDLVAVPSLGWRLTPRNSLHVVFIPRFVIPANAVHVMFEHRLGEGRSGPRAN